MARIPRWTQKIFAGSASNNGVFGSAADNTKILSNSLSVIQSKAAYATGWISSVLGNKKFPPLEEFQSLHYMTTTQISYLFQEGIPEYDAGTTYYQNSIVKKSGTFELYGSLTNDNIGNPLTDALNWDFLVDLAGSAIIPNASTTERGIIQLATLADILSNNNNKAVTPDLMRTYGFVTGDGKEHWGANLQAGWVWADGKTIGNTASNATNRANPDTESLFKYFWASYPAFPIYNSSGSVVSRGASADADWASNRAIPVIDKRGRVSAGKDNMGGTSAGRLSGQTGGVNGNVLGNAGGTETHSLNGNENGPHSHGYNYSYWNPPEGGIQGGQGGGVTFSSSTTSSSGSGSPHNNVQPTIICNYVVKL